MGWESLMDHDAALDGLAGSLLQIVADPSRIGVLYGILGEYCHLFRNRLHSLRMSLYLAKGSVPASSEAVWHDLERRYDDVEQLLDQLQVICRPMRLNPIQCALGTFVEDRIPTWAAWLAARGRPLEINPPQSAAIGFFDPTKLTQGLDSLASWRSHDGAPGTLVRLGWWAESEQLCLSWDEPDERCEKFATEQLDTPVSLALPLVARVVSAHGGSLAVEHQHGLSIQLRWPCNARCA